MWVQRSGGFRVTDEPHLDPVATQEFCRLLDQATLYAEFGCGGSTVFAAKRGIPVISVDSDPYFVRAVVKKLPADHHVLLKHAYIGQTIEWGYPLRRTPTARWRAYTEAMYAAIRDERRFPDLIMVDGRFRIACALSAARQAAEMSAATVIFFDDYTGRPDYHVVEKWLGKPVIFGRAARFDLNIPARGITAGDVTAALTDPR